MGLAVRGIGATRKIRTAPYLGTRPFVLADQDRFFGRGTDSKTLLELWQGNRITLLTGPVASGKTSLLNAGVFPLLKQNRTYFLPAGRISYGSDVPTRGIARTQPVHSRVAAILVAGRGDHAAGGSHCSRLHQSREARRLGREAVRCSPPSTRSTTCLPIRVRGGRTSRRFLERASQLPCGATACICCSWPAKRLLP